MASNGRPLADLLRDVANQLENRLDAVSAPSSTPPPPTPPTPRHPVDAKVLRLFGPYTNGGRRSNVTGRRSLAVPAQLSSYTHVFCCLDDKVEDLVPNRCAKQRLTAAGLGEKRLTFQGSQSSPHEFNDFLLTEYPKLRQGGGFELLKIAGTTRSRQLTLIPCPNEGYNIKYLKNPQTQIGHATIFIRPLQRNLNLEPICQPECSNVLAGPPQKCVTCGEEFPFSQIKAHSDECIRLQSTSEVQMEVPPESSSAPQSEDRCVSMLTPQESQTARASRTAVTVAHQGNMPAPGTSQGRVSTPPVIINLDPTVDNCDWKMEPDPTEAVKGFRYQILNEHATRKPLNLVMNLGDSSEDRERAIISFYKMAHVEWASPLTCTLKGDPAIGDGVTRHFFSTIMSKLQMGFDICLVPGGTVLFEGQQDHLISSTSPYLLESDFFVVAGRMIGHSFIHGGPTLAGLSPAIIHVLFGGAPEEAIIDIKDCVDLDVRDTIKLLDGTVELSLDEKNAINELAVSWDLPHVTEDGSLKNCFCTLFLQEPQDN